MKIDITQKIREKFNMSLSEYATYRDIDISALRRVIYNDKNTRGKHYKSYKVREILVKDGFLNKNVLELEKRVTYKMRQKERKKIIARLSKHYNLSIKEFYEKEIDYFKDHNIEINYLYVFLSGIGTGTKPGTKAYYINELLKKYPLLSVPIDTKEVCTA